MRSYTIIVNHQGKISVIAYPVNYNVVTLALFCHWRNFDSDGFTHYSFHRCGVQPQPCIWERFGGWGHLRSRQLADSFILTMAGVFRGMNSSQ